MTAQSAYAPCFDGSILAELACPACFGDLCLEGARILCTACHRTYPVVDGIPVLIAEGASAACETS